MRQGRGECVVAGIRQFADEDFVEHHAQGIKIGPAINILAARLFRAHVAGSTNGETGLGELGAVIHGLGDAEV
ncbi:hypothetical protein D3C85_1420940 [compost metagenome]